MVLVIAGSRGLEVKPSRITSVLESLGWWPDQVLSGGARGIDRCGERWARSREVPVVVVAADWDRLGRAAGPVRNGEMARLATHLLAFWDTKSRGTADMISKMSELGKPYHVVRCP